MHPELLGTDVVLISSCVQIWYIFDYHKKGKKNKNHSHLPEFIILHY